jgi:PST family polysaccharide transporter
LLHPSAFGQVALAQVVLSIVGMFSTLGLPAALIQTTADRGKAAFSALVVNVVIGAVVCVSLFAAAPLLGFLLGDQGTVTVLEWLSLTILLGSVTRVPEALIQKELLFGRLSIMGIVTEIGTVGVSITLAWMGWGVWSLVYGAIAGATVNAVMAWMLMPGVSWVKPGSWDRGIIKGMLRFGIRMVGSTSVYTFYSYMDSYVVGRMLGTNALGYYSRAFDLTSKTVDSVNRTISVVLFPSYAQLQEDPDRLSRAYLKSLRMIGMLTIPIAVGLFSVAEELVTVLLGGEWVPAIPVLKILTFMSLLKPLSSTTSALFISTAHPEYNLRAGLAVTLILAAGIVVLLPWGVEGIALAVVIAHAIGLGYNVYQVQTILPRTVMAMLHAVFPALAASFIMALGVFAARQAVLMMQTTSLTLPAFLALVATGVVAYVGTLTVIQRPLLMEILDMLREKRKPKRTGDRT